MMSLTLGKYCLKWDEYQKNISCSLVDFREKDKFVDVTLMCEDNKHINAHRVILSTGSQLFKNILNNTPYANTIIYMRGVRAINLEAAVEFIYQGETSVNQADLKDFLALAEELQIKGITDNKTENEDTPIKGNIKEEHFDPNEYQADLPTNLRHTESDLLEPTRLYSVGAGLLETAEAETLDDKMTGMMQKINESRKWKCNVCGRISKDKYNMRKHVERKHMDQASHSCQQCGSIFRSDGWLKMHKRKQHSESCTKTDNTLVLMKTKHAQQNITLHSQSSPVKDNTGGISKNPLELSKRELSGEIDKLNKKIKSMMASGEKTTSDGIKRVSVCQMCGKEGGNTQIRNHIEAHHIESLSLPCGTCEKTFSSRISLSNHIGLNH